MSITITLFLSFYKDLPIGVFAASIAAFTAVQNSTKGLFRGVGELYEYNKYAQDFYAFIEDQSEILSCTIGQLNSIECKNLCFTYPDVKRETLKNINFKLNKGESVAIVGENGSGKTTLVKLLLNLYLPDKGSIIFNGEELLKQQNVILNEASVIQQDIMQYAFSLRANVAISDFSRFENDEKIKGCLEYAGLKRDTNLEEVLSPEFGGKDLSKGQWQRVSIARGLFRNREFLFVDEPTAAIDPMSEYDLLRKLLFLKDQKTMVIVSHRCGICKYTDRIIVMKQGKIAESGTHQELLSVNGEYKRMFTEQAKWYN